MKKNIQLAALFVVLFLFQYFLPWWSMVFPCLALGYITGSKPFRAGFLFVFTLWLGAMLCLDIMHSDRISRAFAQLLLMPNKYLLFIVSAVIGGVTGGLCSLLGFRIRQYRETGGNSNS